MEPSQIPDILSHLNTEIQTNAPNLSLNTIEETRQSLRCVVKTLNKVQNSKLAINRIIPDILYRIFTLSVHTSALPGTTALNISHVCTHWRKFALECSILWGFVDLSARSISNLFVQRSGNTPITLSWTTRYHLPLFEHPSVQNSNLQSPHLYRASKLHLESCSNHILPRLSALILHLSYTEFTDIRHIFQNIEPLRLRRLDIGLYTSPGAATYADLDTPWTDIVRMDMRYLRELRLGGLELPWSHPPHDNLTHLSINHPTDIPKLAHLLTFLRHCPRLSELELYLSDDITEDYISPLAPTAIEPDPLSVSDSLDFPHLTKLELGANGPRGYRLIREFSAYLRFVCTGHTRLSSFSLKYEDIFYAGDDVLSISPSFNIFELVPLGTLSHFVNHQHLCINLMRPNGIFIIDTSPIYQPTQSRIQGPLQAQRRRRMHPTSRRAVHISGVAPPGRLFDHSPILKLIHGMPDIKHLTLISSAWEVLTSWDIDVAALFPNLTTLELSDHRHPVRDCMGVLTSFNFNLHTLILRSVRVASSADILGVAKRIGLRVLELEECQIDYDIIASLRAKGITIIVFEEPKFTA